MTQAQSQPTREPVLPDALARRFEAIVFGWDGTAVPDRRADAAHLRDLIEQGCLAGIDFAIVAGTHIGNVDGQLKARPAGPGELVMLLNRGAEIFSVGRDGPRLVHRRDVSADEDAALSRAAELTVERLAQSGLQAEIVSEPLNRRKIELIPEPEWADPPKVRIDELLFAVEARLASAGIAGLTEVVEIARAAAADAGVADPRVTGDAKHLEIGLTDKSDSARWTMRWLWERGIASEQVLIAGNEMGSLGGLPGSDSWLRVGDAVRSTGLSVGVEPAGVPEGVVLIGGGPDRFAAVLEDQLERRRNGELPISAEDPEWTLVIDGADPAQERVHESLLTLADGRLGTRGSLIAGGRSGNPAVLMSGCYTRVEAATFLLNGPRWNEVELSPGPSGSVRRVLDLHTGTISQQFGPQDAAISALLLSSLERPGVAVLRVLGRAGRIRTTRPLKPPAATYEEGQVDGCSWMRITGRPASIVAAASEHLSGTAEHGVLDRIAAYEGAAQGVADEDVALDRLQCARAFGFDPLLCEHRQAWASRWEQADVHIDGDPELARAARLAVFHVLSSAPEGDEAAVGARGLTGEAYLGHVFWDTDVYVLPVLAATHPRAARAVLEYRVRRLPAAISVAKNQGRSGARFPWESAQSGRDVTPESARDGRGDRVAILTGPLEEHIVADVAWAAACYIDWTGDRAFADGAGRELIVQTARWWASRIESDEDGRGHIRGVIGPDEYHERVDDNAYTNVMARWNLRRAASIGAGVVEDHERYRWLNLADAIVDGYDPATGIYEEFEGFNSLEPLLIAEFAPERRRPVAADMLLGPERTHASQVVKQADVLMLHYLVPDELAAGSLAPNLDFYDPRTAHGSTLSPGVHAALLARAGRLPEALDTLRLCAQIDLDDLGHSTSAGLHLAGMASVWRAVVFGFAGVRPAGDALAIEPVLAPGWEGLEVRVRFRGSRVRVRIRTDAVEVTANPPIDALAPGGDRVSLSHVPHSFELSPPLTSRSP